MEEAKKEEKKSVNSTKKKKYTYDPKWKTKKEETKASSKAETKKTATSKTVKKDSKSTKTSSAKKTTTGKTSTKKTAETKKTKTAPKKKVKEETEILEVLDEKSSPKVSKKEGKKVNKEKLVSKFNIEKTMTLLLPSPEELERMVQELDEKEAQEKAEAKRVNRKWYYGFRARIATLIIFILLFLTLCVCFLFKAFNYDISGPITYSEYTSNTYAVCENASASDNSQCMGVDLQYDAGKTKIIHSTFNYESLYSKKVHYKSNYYVLSKLKVYDETNNSKVRYTDEEVLINKTKMDVNSKVISFSTDMDIDFVKYREQAKKYIEKIGVASKADLEVGLYIEEGDLSRKVSYITIPLSDESFGITSSNLDNQNQNLSTRLDNIDTGCLFLAILCLLMDILLFIYLVAFLYLITHLDNQYNRELKRILKEYDSVIVNADSHYVVSDKSRCIEVTSFKELLDARNSIDKPIVYEKINNVKSKFFVEDDRTVYMYTMKDEGK